MGGLGHGKLKFAVFKPQISKKIAMFGNILPKINFEHHKPVLFPTNESSLR